MSINIERENTADPFKPPPLNTPNTVQYFYLPILNKHLLSTAHRLPSNRNHGTIPKLGLAGAIATNGGDNPKKKRTPTFTKRKGHPLLQKRKKEKKRKKRKGHPLLYPVLYPF